MMRWLARAFQLFILLSSLGLVALVGVITLIDAHALKNPIQKYLHSLIRHPATIKGKMRWTISNGLGLEMEDIVFTEKGDSTQNFLTIQKARWVFYLKGFLSGQGSNLEIYKAQLTLHDETYEDGGVEALLKYLKNGSLFEKLSLTNLKIYQSQLEYKNVNSNQHYVLKNIQFDPGNVLKAASSKITQGALKFHIEDHLRNNTAFVDIKTDWAFIKALKTLDFQKILMTVQIPNIPIMRFNLSSKFHLSNALLEISDFQLQVKKWGSVQGHLKISPLQWQDWRSSEIKGFVQGTSINLGEVAIRQFSTHINLQNKVLDFSPVEVKFADGFHHGNLQIDLTRQTPKFRWSQESTQFHIEPLMRALGHANKIEGRAFMKGFLTSEGSTLSEIKNNLNGQFEMEVANGKILGIDIPELLKHAQGTVKSLIYAYHNKQTFHLPAIVNAELAQWQTQAEQADKFSFAFNTVKGSFAINAGILTNQDLCLSHPLYTLRGNGSLDFSNQDFRFSVSATHRHTNPNTYKEVAKFLNETPLQILIKGTLQDPSLRPELENYAELAVNFSQHNMFENFVDKNLDKLFDTNE